MQRPVIVLRPDEDHVTAANVMREEKIKRLPAALHGKLLGIVSMSDLAAIASSEAEKLRGALRFFTAVVRTQSSQSAVSGAAPQPAPGSTTELPDDEVRLFDAGGPG